MFQQLQRLYALQASWPVLSLISLDGSLLLPPRVVKSMRDSQVSLEEILTHKASVLERRADLTRVRLPTLVARLVPLALVLT